MLSQRQRRVRGGLRLALGIAAAGVAAAAFTTPANASPVSGTLSDGFVKDTAGSVLLDKVGSYKTGLFEMKTTAGHMLQTYCIDLHHPTKHGATYDEAEWSATGLGDNAKYVNWILHNSYPSLSLDQVVALVKLPGVGSVPGLSGVSLDGLTRQEAVAATQAAIWHFSDRVDMTGGSGVLKGNKHVELLYKLLTSLGVNKGLEQPKQTLSLSKENLSGEPGQALGPITVTSTADMVKLALKNMPAGSRIVGADKVTEISQARNGDVLYVILGKGKPEGKGELDASALTNVKPGRAFISRIGGQKMILASSEVVTILDSTGLSWATKSLPAFTTVADTACTATGTSGGKNGVWVTVSNSGSAEGKVTVKYGSFNKEITVPPAGSQKVFVPVAEGAQYQIGVTGLGGYEKKLQGTLNCKPSASPSTGGQAGGLPVTGTSLPIIVGGALLLLAAGGVTLFVLRRRRTNGASA